MPCLPYCWSELGRGMDTDLPKKLAAPAMRALSSIGITHISQVARLTEREIKRLHGIGPDAMVKLKAALKRRRLAFSGN
jgi:hypothetical protein